MGIQIDSLPHDCGTKKALKVFLQDYGKVDGFCFACQTPVKNPYGEEKVITDFKRRPKKSEEEVQREIAEISGYQTLDIAQRKLRSSTLSKFDARVSVSEKDGRTPTAIYWPITKDSRITGYHVKSVDKSFSPFNIGDTIDCDPIGWKEARVSGAYRLIITEGPEDMASIDRIFEMHGDKEWPVAVISLPHGTSSAKKSLSKISEQVLHNFKEVVLCFDNDAAGDKAVENAMQVFPNAKVAKLPAKDANEALVAGAAKAAYNAIAFHSKAPKTTSLVFAGAIHEDAREQTQFGEYTWPFAKMNDALRGIRLKSTIYVGAGVKMGKSDIRNELAAHLIKTHGIKVFMACPEETNKQTYKRIAGKVANRIFHDPKVDFDFKAFDQAGEVLKDNLALVNLYQHIGWDSLKKDIIAAATWGAKVHFIDPITNLTNGISSSDTNTMLQGIAQEIASLSMDLDITVFLFCHLKAPDGNISADQRLMKYKQNRFVGLGNCPHELGGDVLSAQFAGSRAMMRSAHLMIGLEGNKDPELPEEVRNIRHLRVLEDREFGVTDRFSIFWDKHTGRYREL